MLYSCNWIFIGGVIVRYRRGQGREVKIPVSSWSNIGDQVIGKTIRREPRDEAPEDFYTKI